MQALTALVLAAVVHGNWKGQDIKGYQVKNNREIAVNDGSIHVCIFSDRVEGLTATIKSAALNAQNPERIHIWAVTDNSTAIEIVDNRLKEFGVHFHTIPLSTVDDDLVQHGHLPVWLWDKYNTSRIGNSAYWNPTWATSRTAHPANWDHNTMHMHPLNHLRFYIPHMPEFADLDRVIFMDDDLIIQGDMQHSWNAKQNLTGDKILAAACEVWTWDHTYQSFRFAGKNSNFHTATVLAEGGRDRERTFCGKYVDPNNACVGRDFYTNLEARALKINGKPYEPESQGEWNFGFTLIDLDKWRRFNMTKKYEEWMHANYEDHIFPETTLMYGLGIAFLTFYDKVSCWSDITMPKVTIRDGYGYITYSEFKFNGLSTDYLADAFVIHYDGQIKPWHDDADPVFKYPYTMTMKGKGRSEYRENLENESFVRNMRHLPLNNSFVVLSNLREDSKWFMRQLENHNPEVCIGDLNTMNPGKLKFHKDTAMKSSCLWNFVKTWVPKVSLKHEEWCSNSSSVLDISIHNHLPKLCEWSKSLTLNSLIEGKSKHTLFTDYFTRYLSNDWSYQCPARTKMVGVRFMTNWLSKSPVLDSIEQMPIKPKIIYLAKKKTHYSSKRKALVRKLRSTGAQILGLSIDGCKLDADKCMTKAEKFLS